jgi:hypothetical protein
MVGNHLILKKSKKNKEEIGLLKGNLKVVSASAELFKFFCPLCRLKISRKIIERGEKFHKKILCKTCLTIFQDKERELNSGEK